MENEKKTTAADERREYSLNDDRRVKVLTPGQMVLKRFLRNRIAVAGLVILTLMFLFSFVGGLLSPYSEDQLFYREETMMKDYAAVKENHEFRFSVPEGSSFGTAEQAFLINALNKGADFFSFRNNTYRIVKEGEDFYRAERNGETVCIACKDIVSPSDSTRKLPFVFIYASLKAYIGNEKTFTLDGATYETDPSGTISRDQKEVAYISRYAVQGIMPDVVLTRSFKDSLIDALNSGSELFSYTGENGEIHEYPIEYVAAKDQWIVRQETGTRVFDTYSAPSSAHWLGTDRNGMDMLTRLMYGGRVSLLVGFLVEFIATVLGVILGGISGYFGKWVDNLIMRIVDVFYCIPSTPIIIILGAAMDAMDVDPRVRMIYLMLILGFLGWPSVARLVRGQILSLREQEFMTATEATGLSVRRRIIRHLVPNVIPQLIVSCTMGLGSTIIMEATLSFLGLGVKFPFASWGNIINDVNNTFVLTNYWFIWIPAGFCLLITVLAFNLVGDGLRDAFDPRMNR